jgi:putative spermidine/putrescine transport system permease protein
MALSAARAETARASRSGGRLAALRPTRWSLLVVPALALLAIAFAYPVFDILRRSFTEPATGLENYRLFFDTPAYVTILRRTFVTALIVTAVCLTLGYPYAYLMTVVRPRWRVVLLAVVLVPFWTSLMVRTYSWIVLLQDTGVINDVLAALGIGRLSLIRNTLGVTIGMTQILLPFMVLPLYSTMQGIDRRLLQAAEGLGARPLTAFWRVYVPLSLPGVTAGVTLVFILALGFYVTPALLGSPQNALLSQLIVQQVSQLLNFGAGGAMAAILLVATLVLFAAVSRIVRPSRAFGAVGGDR